MSKQVDTTVPLSDEDREYLKQRSRHWEIDENDRVHKKGKYAEDADTEFTPNYTVAAAPITPGSAADNPPKFVGARPHGVDRGVWGGATGLTEDEALAGNAGEPHHTQKSATDDAVKAEDAEAEEGVAIDDLTDEQLKAELAERSLPTDGDRDSHIKLLTDALTKDANED